MTNQISGFIKINVLGLILSTGVSVGASAGVANTGASSGASFMKTHESLAAILTWSDVTDCH